MLKRGFEFRRELPVSDEHHSYHIFQVRTLLERSRYFVHREAKRKSIETKSSSQCHDRVANTTQAIQRDVG